MILINKILIKSVMYFYEKNKINATSFGYEIEKKLDSIKTKFQTIEVFATKNHGNLMVIDGFIMLTTRDNYFYHEVMGNAGLIAHNDPKNVLIIGGGDCGTLSEVLKHDTVIKCTQVDIDKAVTDLAEKHFPELTLKNNDLRADINFSDGIKWLENTKDSTYDVIIIDSTDPIGPAEGLFNQSFHDNCFRALKSDGILIQQSDSPIFHSNILTEIRDNLTKATFKKIITLAFPQPCYPSGLWSATIAAKIDIDWRYKSLEKISSSMKFLSIDMLKSLVMQSNCWPSAHKF